MQPLKSGCMALLPEPSAGRTSAPRLPGCCRGKKEGKPSSSTLLLQISYHELEKKVCLPSFCFIKREAADTSKTLISFAKSYQKSSLLKYHCTEPIDYSTSSKFSYHFYFSLTAHFYFSQAQSPFTALSLTLLPLFTTHKKSALPISAVLFLLSLVCKLVASTG